METKSTVSCTIWESVFVGSGIVSNLQRVERYETGGNEEMGQR